MDRWEEHSGKWQSWAATKGVAVEFAYIGESELLGALTLPGQSGRAYHWFNATVFTQEWFDKHIAQAIETAGPRYTPELNVDFPIATVFDGLGRTLGFQTQLRTYLRKIRDTRKWYFLRDLPSPEPGLMANLKHCEDMLDILGTNVIAADILSEIPIDLLGIAAQCNEIAESLWGISGEFREQARELDDSQKTSQTNEPETIGRKEQTTLESAAYQLSRTARSVQDLKECLESDAGRVVNLPALLITGEAGTGKTHLLCDVAQSRIKAGQPTVMLFGQQFGTDEPWGQILNQLHLNCSVDEFLGALDAAAEARNSRALIFIDALNEGQGVNLWLQYLTGFMEKARHWPRVRIAATCRSIYLEAVVPEALDSKKLVRINHEGFTGREDVAVRTFFDHYKLQLPDFPLLFPEFQNPLFLKIMCAGLSESGFTNLPRGSTGLTALFNFFLDSVEGRLWLPNRCDYPQDQQLVPTAVGEIAQKMVDSGQDWLEFDVARILMEKLLPSRPWSKSLLNGLLSEGILIRDKVSLEGGPKDAVLFFYQRFGDHLRATILCDGNSSPDALKTLCGNIAGDRMTSYRHSGLLQALSVILPERFDLEFHDLVPDPTLEPIEDSYLESLIWRQVEAFPEDLNLEYLNRIMRSGIWGNERVFGTILQIACIPNHPLNADLLHDTLWGLSVADRDSWWSIFLYHHSGEESQIDRIVDWAWTGETQACSDDAALLCATTLAWFLTCSRRSLRDCATKALVALLHRRHNLVRDLLCKFQGVNDPYVAERIYAIAYGCCLISSDKEGIQSVAGKVYELVFSEGQAPIHLLLRDYARGTLERAEILGCLPQDVDWTRVRPPYQSPWPITAPSDQNIRKKYRDDSDGYGLIWISLMQGIADFKKYIVSTAVNRFVAGNQRARQTDSLRMEKQRARVEKQKAQESLEQFSDSLSDDQVKILSKLGKVDRVFSELHSLHLEQQIRTLLPAIGGLDGVNDPPHSSPHGRLKGLSEFYDLLTELQRENLLSGLRHNQFPKKPRRLIPFDPTLACRWIFGRVLRLGWRPDRFGDFDHQVSYYPERSNHKTERIGKKYQWIGFHEVLARSADHCQVFETWSGLNPRDYDGPWEIGASVRDIDPSLLLRSCNRVVLESFEPCWWAPDAVSMSESPTTESREQWLRDGMNLPEPLSLIDVQDTSGRRWLALEGHYTWEEPVPPEVDRFDTERCHMWHQIRSYLVRKGDLAAFKAWAVGRNWMGKWMPEGQSFHGVFLGEYPWHPSNEEWRREWEEPGERSVPVPAVVTSAIYTNAGNDFDCSVDDPVSGMVPSSYLFSGLDLIWSGNDFRYLNSEGKLMAWDPTAQEIGPPALLVDPHAMSEFLKKEDLALVWTVLGEKQITGSGWDQSAYKGHLESYGFLTLEADEVNQISEVVPKN